jgi:Flp pilus assembly protein TadB
MPTAVRTKVPIRRPDARRVETSRKTWDDGAVPLSEDEQRILRQIEQELQQDPAFATRVHRVPRHRVALLFLGLLAAIALTVLGLGISYWLAFAAFLAVLALAVSLERELRVIARDRLGTLPISVWLGGARRRTRDDG